MLKVQAKKLRSVAVISLQGQIVTGESDILRDAVQSVSEVSSVKLDLARVTTIDAGGLGVMLELREQAEANGIRFELMNLTKQIRRIFQITRLDSVFRITAVVEFFPGVARNRQGAVARYASCA